MKKLIALAFLLSSLTSCLTVDRISKNCDKFAQICTTDRETVTIKRDTTIYRTDTIFYQLPPDTVKIVETVEIVNNQAQMKPINKQFGFIGVNAWIKNNSLNINAWLTDSTILIPYRDTILIADAFTNTTTASTIIIDKKHIPGFYKFCFWLVISSLAALLIFVAWKILNFKFKISKLLKSK